MRVIMAAGGTAGHINPALAIAGEIMKNQPDSEVLFVGRADGMEKNLVAAAGYAFHHIETHGFSRGFKLESLFFNLKVPYYVWRAEREAKKLFERFQPDLVMGCGGYSSGPVVRRAAKMGIKTAIQEQNSVPGVTTKLLARVVDLVMVASDDARERLDCKEKCLVVGNPVRDEFFSADRNKLRREWGVGDRTCMVSFGGSLGARTINQLMAKFMQRHVGTGAIYHIHAVGQYGTKLMPELLKEYSVRENDPSLRIVEYIENMPQCFAAADLIVSRAGAITTSEIAAAGKASVLIPSPNVAENHQFFNAKTLEKAGAALVFEESEFDLAAMSEQLFDLAVDRQRLKMMGVNARSVAVPHSAKRIYDNLVKILD